MKSPFDEIVKALVMRHQLSACAAVLTLCGAFGVFSMPAFSQQASSQKISSVTVARVELAEIIGRVPVSGTTVARDEVLIYPEINGFLIESLTVEVGDSVRTGDSLVVLSNSTLTVQLAQAEAELTRANAAIEQAKSGIDTAQASKVQSDAALDRAQQLRKSGSTSQASLDQALAAAQTADAQVSSAQGGLAVAMAQRQQAQAQLDIANLNLSRAEIVAPTNGLISERNGQIGAIASSSGNPIYKIIRDGIVEVEAEVIETALGQIETGNAAELDIAGIGQVRGQIRRISPTVDPLTRLGTIRIEMTEAPDLRTGLFAGGWIVTAQRISATVPATAILTDKSGNYVLAVQDDTVRKAPVVAGLIWKNRREIVSGLQPDELVIARAGAFFADGDVIKPVFAEDAADAEPAR